MGDTMFGKSPTLIFAFACLAVLGGCNESKTDSGAFDSSRLPRVSGAKEVFASAASTIFTSPEPVAHKLLLQIIREKTGRAVGGKGNG